MNPNVLKLSISTPQPRLNETFYLNLDISDLKADIFGALAAEIKPTAEVLQKKNGITTIKVSSHTQSEQVFSVMKIANETGKFEAGPLAFELNGTKYTTNKISYEIIEPLPNTDKGLWFRKIMVGKKMVCIIIEQRISAKKFLKTKNGIISGTNETLGFPFVRFKTHHLNPIVGLNFKGSHSGTGEEILTIGGKTKLYNYNYSISYFEIIDSNTKITLTKENFENMPKDYEFKDIVVMAST